MTTLFGNLIFGCVFFSSRRRHTRYWRDWSSDVCSSDLTVEPNGHRHSRPILKVCSATGMPMMVQNRTRLPVKYPKAASKPPKRHQMMFPIIFMFAVLVKLYMCKVTIMKPLCVLLHKSNAYIWLCQKK